MSDWKAGDEDRRSQSWHVKKEFSVGHILTTITMIMGVIFAYTDITKHQAVSDAQFNSHVKAQERQEARQDTANHEILAELKHLRKDMYEFFQAHNSRHNK